jgi:hypothetical protein
MSYSANDNQNFFVSSGRTTSRVIAQPGGQCNISIGGWTPEELELQRQKREAAEKKSIHVQEAPEAGTTNNKDAEKYAVSVPVGKENNETVEATVSTTRSIQEPTISKPTVAANVSSNAFASAANTNAFNVITDRPTSRVTRPPGGHTSIVLG